MTFPRVHGEHNPDYIGDGVYATHDAWGMILLRTERDGHWELIALEPNVFEALTRYRDAMWLRLADQQETIQTGGPDEPAP